MTPDDHGPVDAPHGADNPADHPVTVHFTRAGASQVTVRVERDGARDLEWSVVSVSFPHDLAHLVVESCLDLRHAFWGEQLSGTDLMARRGRPPAEPEVPEAELQLLQAEAATSIVAPTWHSPPVDGEAARQELGSACARRGIPVPAGATAAALQRALDSLVELGREWARLEHGEVLSTRYPLDQPLGAREGGGPPGRE